MRRLQADNQLHRATFPVMLRQSWNQAEQQMSTPPPALELLVQRRVGAADIVLYETISLRLQTLELMVDTVLVRILLLFGHSLFMDLSRLVATLLKGLGREEAEAHRPQKVYLRWLNIQPLRLLLSCRSVAGDRSLGQLMRKQVPPGAVGLLSSASTLITNIDRAPLKLNALVLDNFFGPPGLLASNLASSYKEQLLQQLYKLMLSFEALGNPRGLFTRMATGVTDAFYEPMQGMLRGPEEFAQGMLRGGKSLADNVR